MRLRGTIQEIFTVFSNKKQSRIQMLEQVAERIESQMQDIGRAQDRFATAMTSYAEHLNSHTGAIEDLRKASLELTNNSIDQTKALTSLVEFIKRSPVGMKKTIPEIPRVIIDETIVFPPGCYKRRRSQDGTEVALL